jgi:hypothetical protein
MIAPDDPDNAAMRHPVAAACVTNIYALITGILMKLTASFCVLILFFLVFSVLLRLNFLFRIAR